MPFIFIKKIKIKKEGILIFIFLGLKNKEKQGLASFFNLSFSRIKK
jgi:hypothetical protein